MGLTLDVKLIMPTGEWVRPVARGGGVEDGLGDGEKLVVILGWRECGCGEKRYTKPLPSFLHHISFLAHVNLVSDIISSNFV